MSADLERVLSELPLPLGPEATTLDAVALAVAIEDACGVVLPDDLVTVARLRDRETIRSVLHSLTG